jgi:ComF family protein
MNIISELLNKAKGIAVDAVFPNVCICGKWGEVICVGCRSKIKPYKTQLCPVCQRITKTGKTCKNCYKKSKLTGLLVYGRHDGLLKDLIWRYKYLFVIDLGKYFGELLTLEFGPELIERELLITFVPATKERMNWRGFNQSEVIAREVSRRTGLEIEELLMKEGKIAPQVGLTGKERAKNIQGKIKVLASQKVRNKKIVIIDDVFTTGSTLTECAKMLRRAGAKEVWGLTVSRD